MTTLTLPYPISANRYWSNYVLPGSKRAMQGPSTEAKAYRRTVQKIAMAAGLVRPRAGLVEVELVLHPCEPKDAAKRERKDGARWHMGVRCIDVDNCVKVAIDALKGVAFVDDDQVWTLVVNRGLPTPNGALVVHVRDLDLDQTFPAPPQLALPLDEYDPFAEMA